MDKKINKSDFVTIYKSKRPEQLRSSILSWSQANRITKNGLRHVMFRIIYFIDENCQKEIYFDNIERIILTSDYKYLDVLDNMWVKK